MVKHIGSAKIMHRLAAQIEDVQFDELTKKKGDLKQRYWMVLRGFEDFSFSEEQIYRYIFDFEAALADLKTCMGCYVDEVQEFKLTGMEKSKPMYRPVGCECESDLGWFGLNKSACSFYERPVFAVHMCRGAQRRKRELAQLLTAEQTQMG